MVWSWRKASYIFYWKCNKSTYTIQRLMYTCLCILAYLYFVYWWNHYWCICQDVFISTFCMSFCISISTFCVCVCLSDCQYDNSKIIKHISRNICGSNMQHCYITRWSRKPTIVLTYMSCVSQRKSLKEKSNAGSPSTVARFTTEEWVLNGFKHDYKFNRYTALLVFFIWRILMRTQLQ
jgi:hypothetical protein